MFPFSECNKKTFGFKIGPCSAPDQKDSINASTIIDLYEKTKTKTINPKNWFMQ